MVSEHLRENYHNHVFLFSFLDLDIKAISFEHIHYFHLRIQLMCWINGTQYIVKFLLAKLDLWGI